MTWQSMMSSALAQSAVGQICQDTGHTKTDGHRETSTFETADPTIALLRQLPNAYDAPPS